MMAAATRMLVRRVAALVARNRVFYRRQRCCESFTAFVIIVSFSSTLHLHLQPN